MNNHWKEDVGTHQKINTPCSGTKEKPQRDVRRGTIMLQSHPISARDSCAVLSRFSHVRLFATPWTVAHQAFLSIGFSRQEYWSGLRSSWTRDRTIEPIALPWRLQTPGLGRLRPNYREGTQPHTSAENWIKDLLNMILPTKVRPTASPSR